MLWVSLIVIGTFLRGPGWNWFWPWEKWDMHKVEAMTNIDLPYLVGLRDPLWSSIFGLTVVAGYFVLGTTAMYAWIRRLKGALFMQQWGMARFMTTSFLFLNMLAVLLKMVMRHALNIKYILVTPWINI